MANFIGGIISLALGIIVLTNVYLNIVHTTNTSTALGWTSAEIALWGVMGLLGIIGLMFGVLNVFGIV